MALSSVERRVLSLPCRVRWGGFESTTSAMQQAGWELSAEQDTFMRRIRLALRHRDWNIRGLSDAADCSFIEEVDSYGPSPNRHLPMFNIRFMATDFIVNITDNLSSFQPIDAMPQVVNNWERKSMDDFGIFAAPLVRTEEIIVEPKDVMYHLDQIRKMQVPEQQAIRARARTRNYDEPGARQVFHAQILSFHQEAA